MLRDGVERLYGPFRALRRHFETETETERDYCVGGTELQRDASE